MTIKPTPRTRGFRYVDVRLAIPDDSPYPPSSGEVVGYLQSPWNSRASSSLLSSASYSSKVQAQAQAQAPSPYTFIPLAPPNDDDDYDDAQQGGTANHKTKVFSPPSSPFDFRKAAPSPALTATTVDSSVSDFGVSFDSFRTSPAMGGGGYISPLAFPPIQEESYSKVCSPPVPVMTTPSKATASVNRRRYEQVSSPTTTTPRKSPDAPASSKGRKSPFARGNDDDSVRKSRIKTELCMHYERGSLCPFGSNCTYAHGEEELQMTKLMDLHRAGLIDVETYRTKPCLTWITTGSCPFGKRCTSVHDKRVAGEHASWLPHTETQGNTIATDINVEGLHQKRLFSLLHDNPFGSQFSLAFDDWESLYKLVCNTTEKNRRRRCSISAVNKTAIALQMQGPSDWYYKFRPQHIIHDELCMVLQERAFKLKATGEAFEIPVTSFNPRSPNQVVVREISFGPDCDPSVRNVALWFNIDDQDVTLCTPQQAKRYRWKRGLNNTNSKANERTPNSVFEYLECFFMVRPHDRDAYDLTTRILQHRLGVLRMERSSGSLRERNESMRRLEREKLELKKLIECQVKHWTRWAWPINDGRAHVDDQTPVPVVDGYYFRNTLKMATTSADSEAKATVAEKIWGSFVSNSFADAGSPPRENKCPWGNTSTSTSGRLSIFRRLGLGEAIGSDRNLPHIRMLKNKNSSHLDRTKKVSEQCWRSLLLERDHGPNEWNIVREHFENSRSKKVLTILQQ